MKPLRMISLGVVSLFAFTALSGLAAEKTYVFGVIAKSNNNPFFQPAKVGAEEEAKALSQKNGANIKIDWRTPNEEDAQKQVEAIEQLVNSGASGIAVSCSDANKLTDAINKAVASGVPVLTFDSDAPQSKRLAWFGTDNYACGKLVMSQLAKELGDHGVVAILGGNPNAPNLQQRVKGVVDEAKSHPGIKVIDTFYHKETPQDAVSKVEQVTQAHPELTGWAFAGGWPLFTDNAIKWKPGSIKVTCVDALLPEIAYLKAGYVQVLLSQDVYGWATTAVDTLYDYVANGKKPAQTLTSYDLVIVDKTNVDAFAKNWDKWLGTK